MVFEKTPDGKSPPEDLKRQRRELRELFESCGSQNISENELLALLLGFSLKGIDCVEAANFLLRRFGSFTNIFDASIDALLELPFIDLNTALLLKSVPELCRRELREKLPKNLKISTPNDAKAYLYHCFLGYNMETAFALLVDKRSFPIKIIKLGTGFAQRVDINTDTLSRDALMAGASAFVLAHSHPGGKAKPSRDDEIATLKIAHELSVYGIRCLDHLIFSSSDCYFMSSSPQFDKTILAFSKRNS